MILDIKVTKLSLFSDREAFHEAVDKSFGLKFYYISHKTILATEIPGILYIGDIV